MKCGMAADITPLFLNVCEWRCGENTPLAIQWAHDAITTSLLRQNDVVYVTMTLLLRRLPAVNLRIFCQPMGTLQICMYDDLIVLKFGSL